MLDPAPGSLDVGAAEAAVPVLFPWLCLVESSCGTNAGMDGRTRLARRDTATGAPGVGACGSQTPTAEHYWAPVLDGLTAPANRFAP